jgi:hypothetical protein
VETLASLFVSLIAAVNAFAPGANLPQVLGVQTENQLRLEPVAQEAIQTAQQTRQKAYEQFQEKQLEMQQLREQKREEFQQRLDGLKNQQKVKVLERSQNRLTSIQQKWLESWSKTLDRLSAILAKMDARVEELASQGVDTGGIESAIADAQEAIDEAEEELDNLAGEVFVIDVSDEESLGQDVRALIGQFKDQMREVLSSVKAAKEAVVGVYRMYLSINTGEENEE